MTVPITYIISGGLVLLFIGFTTACFIWRHVWNNELRTTAQPTMIYTGTKLMIAICFFNMLFVIINITLGVYSSCHK